MIRSITIKARDIYGAADTIYDGRTNLGELFFQEVLGLSFSGDGITYVIEKDISSITISSERLTGIIGSDVVRSGLVLYLDAGTQESFPIGEDGLPGGEGDPEGGGESGIGGNIWYDINGNGHSCVLMNGVGYSTDAGGTLVFDGVDDYVDTNMTFSSDFFTVGAWFKTSASGINMIISTEEFAGNPWNYRIWLNGGQLVADIAQGAVQSSLTSPLTNYNNGNWYNVFFTRNDDVWVLYVNGVQVATKADNFTGSIQNSQEVWIGRSVYLGGSYAYNGEISTIFIYDRDLSPSEILQNFDASKERFGY